ncbi:MAG: DUF167 family protein [Rhizomicrobium sp.]
MSARFTRRAGALRIVVKLTPRGGRDAIEEWGKDSAGNPHLKARVSAPPEDGKANRALIVLLADALDIPKSAIRIAAGETSRLKTIEIDGDRPRLEARLSEF